MLQLTVAARAEHYHSALYFFSHIPISHHFSREEITYRILDEDLVVARIAINHF
jgi:hypothetical protein